MQRVPQFELLLEELRKTTPPTHADYEHILKAKELVRDLRSVNIFHSPSDGTALDRRCTKPLLATTTSWKSISKTKPGPTPWRSLLLVLLTFPFAAHAPLHTLTAISGVPAEPDAGV